MCGWGGLNEEWGNVVGGRIESIKAFGTLRCVYIGDPPCRGLGIHTWATFWSE